MKMLRVKCGSRHLSAAQLREQWLLMLLLVAGQEWVSPSSPVFFVLTEMTRNEMTICSIVQFLSVCCLVLLTLGPEYQKCLVLFLKELRVAGAEPIAEQGR